MEYQAHIRLEGMLELVFAASVLLEAGGNLLVVATTE